MSKITLNDVTNINSLSVINDNFDKIEQELQNKVLYRNNPTGEPNTVEKDIDMNGNDLLNVGDVFSANGRWATIDELEDIRDEVAANTVIVEANKDIAVASANAASTSYDNFDDRYLGQKTADPSVDNDGGLLLTGALYFRTSGTPIMRVYNGTTWQDVGSITTTTTNLIDPMLYSSQVEAEAGANNTKVMTPLRVKNAVDSQIKTGYSSTGPIILPSNAVNALEAVPKQQLDAAFPSGWIAAMARLTAPAGWLLVDGKTIGNAASGATSRANADTAALFAELWAFPAASVPIFDNTGAASTRGASAAADFAANKRIALFTPDGGAFLRMWAPGQTADAGRTPGSAQAQALPAITGSAGPFVGDLSSVGSGALSVAQNGGRYAVSPTGSGGQEYKQINLSIGSGADLRPYNLSMPHYIKL